MRYRYFCYKCAYEVIVMFLQGQLKCPVCGAVMVPVETILDE